MKVKTMTKQYNEYSSLSQSDRLGLRINWISDNRYSLYHPMVYKKAVAIKEIGGA